MKISVVCICVFLFCTLYWAFGTSQSLASAENEGSSSSISASIASPENATASTASDSELNEQVVIKSGGDLEPSADIHSSIEEITNEEGGTPLQQQEYAFVETVSQNSGVAHEVAGTGSGVIHTLVDSATLELQEKAEELSAAAATGVTASHHNETPNLNENNLDRDKLIKPVQDHLDKNNISVEIKLEQGSEELSNNTQQTDQPGTDVPSIEPKSNVTEQEGETHEEIPSFSEWTQKQLEEAERRKEQVNSSVQSQQTNGKSSSSSKKRWKNYASPDCGAKIIAANPEAISAGSVLAASRDEYKLNTCTSRIWFIVELCEAIQAKKIDLANFELFSSSPKDFSIYVSDRFPTRDWSSVGQFTAKDERDIQSFDLYPHLFGKYIKFEMHSHHGSEHYCPISLFRVYGTSEFEVLETENQVHANAAEEDDDDETLDSENGAATKNLFSSATDAVISMVKKAAEVLGNKGNGSTVTKDQQNVTVVKYTPLISTCTTPSHIVVCDNCTDILFGNVYELLSCHSKQLGILVSKPIIKKTLYNSNICLKYGLDLRNTATETVSNSYTAYMQSFFPAKLIAALCNTVAINECRVVRNISSSNATTTASLQDATGEKILNTGIRELTPTLDAVETNTLEITSTNISGEQLISTSAETNITEPSYTGQIKPTKTLTPEELNLTIASSNVESTAHEQTVHPTDSLSPTSIQNDTVVNEDKTPPQQVEHIEVSSEVVPEIETQTESSESLEDHLDSLVRELNGESTSNIASTTITPPSMPQGQKESVFLRLSNRIKALERNMSLSSQYLEELSRRYKKQVEEMQRLLDKTINTLNEDNKKKEERTQRLEEQIASLRESVESLIVEKNSWIHITYWVFLSGVGGLAILLFCRRNQEFKQPRDEERTKSPEVQRRKSVDVITHKTPPKKKRRPSEEALLIGGTYTDLLIDEVDSSGSRSKDKKRRKKKQMQQLQRSNSITTLNEEAADNDQTCRTVSSEKGFRFAPKLTSSQIWKRQDSAPPNFSTDWVDDSFKRDRIQDIPFVLEESEHTSLEPFNFNPVLNQKNLANGDKRKENGSAVQSTTFTVTATDSRSKRLQKQKNGNAKSKSGHKKSASFDETKRQKTPSPIGIDAISLSNSFEESSPVADAPKKEKRSTLKKLFRFNFK